MKLPTLVLLGVILSCAAAGSAGGADEGVITAMAEQNDISPVAEMLDHCELLLNRVQQFTERMELYHGWAQQYAAERLGEELAEARRCLDETGAVVGQLRDYLDNYLPDDWIERFEITGFYAAAENQRRRYRDQERLYCYCYGIWQVQLTHWSQSSEQQQQQTRTMLEGELNSLLDELAYFGRNDEQMSGPMLWVVRLARVLTAFEPRALDLARDQITQMLQVRLSSADQFELRWEILRCNLLNGQGGTAGWLSQWEQVRQWMLQQQWTPSQRIGYMLRLTLLLEMARQVEPMESSRPISTNALADLERFWNTEELSRPAVTELVAWPYLQSTTQQQTQEQDRLPTTDFELWCVGRQLQDSQRQWGQAASLWQRYKQEFGGDARRYEEVLYDLGFCAYQLGMLAEDQNHRQALLVEAVDNWAQLARDYPSWVSAMEPDERNALRAAIAAGTTAYNLFLQDESTYAELAQEALATLVGRVDMQSCQLTGPYTATPLSRQYRFYYGLVLAARGEYGSARVAFALVPDNDEHKLTARYQAVRSAWLEYSYAENATISPAWQQWRDELAELIAQVRQGEAVDQTLMGQSVLLLGRLWLDGSPNDPQRCLTLLEQYHDYWMSDENRARQGQWQLIEACAKLGDHGDAIRGLLAYLEGDRLNSSQMMQVCGWLDSWAGEFRTAWATGTGEQSQQWVREQLPELTARYFAMLQQKMIDAEVGEQLYAAAGRALVEVQCWTILTAMENGERAADLADELAATLRQLQSQGIELVNVWGMRGRAVAAMGQGDYETARRWWQQIRLGLEQQQSSEAIDLWWEARIVSLLCLQAQGQAAEVTHVIEVTQATTATDPGQWGRRLELLRSWAEETLELDAME
ncbi:MAG: hypothetical protein JW936_03500 [Sedimentisphaerales bacterium]|nr:hypothetical protein [Sedimentisphaerales bacterium]